MGILELMRNKIIFSLLALSIISCTNPTLNNTSQYSDLDKEYSQFKTQALTQSYLKKKMDKWLSDSKYSKNLVREIEYAKFKHKDLLKDIVALQPIMFTQITANNNVSQKRSEAPFDNYIEYIDPFPSAVTANDATNLTTTSFTANWTSDTNASSYKLFVDGNPITLGNVTSYNVTGLSYGSSHTYYVKAVNSAGESSNSNSISVNLSPDIPLAPTANDATNVTTTSFTANWTSVTNATSYKLYVDGLEVYSGTDTSYSVTDLSYGSSHTYCVKAVNSSGHSSNSNHISVDLLVFTPSAPTANDATSIITTAFTAHWTSVTGASSYKVYIDGVLEYTGTNTSVSRTGFTAGSTHTYYVQALNNAGTSPNSNTITVVLKPLAPVATSATNLATTSFTANWNSVNGATGYNIILDTNTTVSVRNVTSYNFTGLTPNTAHNYYVQAVNAGGTSSNSNTIIASLNTLVSCKAWKNAGASTNGVYVIDPDNNPSTLNNINAYCDMTTSGGGWTLAVAQYETDPTTSWNEGIQADYDPSLATKKSFALNSSQLPTDRTQTGFGKDLLPTDVDYVNFVYTTGDIAKTALTGLKGGVSYQIYRNAANYYHSQNPEEYTMTTDSGWYDSFTFDQTGGAKCTFAFGPYFGTVNYRGYGYKAFTGTTADTFAWTIWVR